MGRWHKEFFDIFRKFGWHRPRIKDAQHVEEVAAQVAGMAEEVIFEEAIFEGLVTAP